MKRISFPLLVCASVVLCELAPAQPATNAPAVTAATNGVANIDTNRPVKVPARMLESLPHKDIFGELSGPLLSRIMESKDTNNPFLTFLSDWHLRPKVFEATGGDSHDANLGFEFDYKKSLANHVINETALHPIGLSLAAQAKGDVAFEADKNPNNLIEAGGSFNLFQGLGGIDPSYHPTPEAQRKLQEEIFAAARHDEAARQRAVKEFTAHMRPQLFYDISAHGNIETDQQFRNRQYVYGGQLGIVFRDWRADSDIGFFNLFDYPFAAIRAMINREPFQPSGRTFPSLVVGIDQVDPSDNKARLAVDPDTDSYGRVRVEVAFKTPVYRWGNDNLYVSAAYRHFSELGASSAIRKANLDHFNYFVAVLDLPYHFNVSYSTGRLPLDRKNDDVYAVGWTLNF